MEVVGRLLAVLAAAEARDILHRPRPVERAEGDDVGETVGANLGQRAAHPLAFELEHADRVAAGDQPIRLGVVERQAREVEVDPLRRQQLLRPLEHRQRLQPEEVELDQPRLLDPLHVELRHRHVGARIAVHRHQLRQRPVADDDAGGVGRGVARQPFEAQGDLEQVRDLGIAVALGDEFADPVQRARQRPRVGRVVGDQLGEAVDLAVRHLQHAPDVLEHGARLELPEGDDLRDLPAAVAALDVADDLAAPRFAEVDVEVGHRHALGVEEALEQQAVLRADRGR